MFMLDPVPNDSNELYILSHTSVTTTAETSFFLDIHKQKLYYKVWTIMQRSYYFQMIYLLE